MVYLYMTNNSLKVWEVFGDKAEYKNKKKKGNIQLKIKRNKSQLFIKELANIV